MSEHGDVEQILEDTYHSVVSCRPLDGAQVIVKRAKRTAEPRVVRNWHNEVALLARVRHVPHTTTLIDSDPQSFTITLQLESGRTLDQCLSVPGDQPRPSELPDPDVVLRHMAEALAHIHAASIVHDDVKPDNIVWSPSARAAVLIDFGAAYDYAQLGPAHFTPSGTPPYAPPEFLRRRKGPEGDVWALGVVLLYVKGICPLPEGEWILPRALEDDGADRAEMRSWLGAVGDMRAQLAPADSVLRDMLDPDPDTRIGAAEVLAALDRQGP